MRGAHAPSESFAKEFAAGQQPAEPPNRSGRLLRALAQRGEGDCVGGESENHETTFF